MKHLPTGNFAEPAERLSQSISASLRLSPDNMAPSHPSRREEMVDVATVRRLGQTLYRCLLLFCHF